MSRYLARSREGGVQTYVCPAKVAYIRASPSASYLSFSNRLRWVTFSWVTRYVNSTLLKFYDCKMTEKEPKSIDQILTLPGLGYLMM